MPTPFALPSAIPTPYTPRSALPTFPAPPSAIPTVSNGPNVSKKNFQLSNTPFSPNGLELYPENNSISVVCGPELDSSSGYKKAFCTRSRKRKLDLSSLSSISTSHFQSPVSQSFISEPLHFLSKKNKQPDIENDDYSSDTDERKIDDDSSDTNETSDHFLVSKIQQTHPELFSEENTSEYEINETFDYTQGNSILT